MPALLVGILAVIVGGRWLATRSGADALLVGTTFGVGLVILAAAAWRQRAVRAPSDRRRGVGVAIAVGIGAVFGLVLVGVSVLGPALAGTMAVPGLGRPAAPFASWAAVTIHVATAEELLLRGVLFDRLERAGGLGVAAIVTTAVFALMHVPLYGWHVVPLDVAVGVGLAGLRVATGSIAAPVAAHAVADLATWWL